MSVICIFGDSTAWGAWDMEKGGWVNRLWLDCAQHRQEIDVYNLSISGGTTETILARLEAESKIRETDVVVFQTGGNDAAYDKDTKALLVSPENFEINLRKIIQKAKSFTNRIAFIGLKNCDESKTVPVSWCNLCYTNELMKKYNDVMKNVCEKNGVRFIDIFGLLNNSDFEDGLHPNASGHQKIFLTVKDPMLEI